MGRGGPPMRMKTDRGGTWCPPDLRLVAAWFRDHYIWGPPGYFRDKAVSFILAA